MSQEPSLGDLMRDFLAAFADYLRQEGSQAVEEIIMAPLRYTARRAVSIVGLLGLALAMTIVAGIFLALAVFHLLLDLTHSVPAAYALAAVVCLLVATLCGRPVHRHTRASQRGAGSGGRESRHDVGGNAGDPGGPQSQVGEGGE